MSLHSKLGCVLEIFKICSIQALSFVSLFIPKDDDKILFTSTPDYSDNPKYLYEKMAEIRPTKKLIWAVDKKINIDCVDYAIRGTLAYYYHILTAKYIISTHGWQFKSKNQVVIELWHGIPLKNIGYDGLKLHGIFSTLQNIQNYVYAKNIDVFVTGSKFTKICFSSTFQIKPGNVVVLGHPRCDALYQSKIKSMNILETLVGKIPEGTKIILYMPTYRTYMDEKKSSKQILKTIIENKDFKDFLNRNNLLFICKPHPYDEKFYSNYQDDNIKVILNSKFTDNHYTIYDFLNVVNILITDYSSIYFDYLLTSNPIIYYIPDFANYCKEPGFFLTPFEEWTPGDKAKNVKELIEAIQENTIHPNKYENERTNLKRIMFKNDDGQSSQRVCDYIIKNHDG